MKRLLKFTGWFFLVLFALFAAIAVAIKVWLPPEKARKIVEDQLTARLHREVRLGAVSVSLLRGVKVSDFAVSEHPTFQNGTFVSSDALQLRLALIPLLGKKVVISDVHLDRPFVHVIRFPDGKFNFSDLRTPKADATATPDTLVNGLTLARGRLHYEDRSPQGKTTMVDSLAFHVGHLNLNGKLDFKGKMAVNHSGFVSTVTFAGALDILKENIEIGKADINHGRSTIFVTGTIESLFSEPLFSIQGKCQPLDLALLQKAGIGGDVRGTWSVRGRPDNLAFDTALNLAEAVFVSTTGFSKPSGVPMSIAANGRLENNSLLVLDPLSLGVGTLRATANGRVNAVMTSSRTFDLSLKTDPLPVEEAISRLPKTFLPAGLTLTGMGDVDLTITGSGTPTVRGRFTMRDGVLRDATTRVSDIRAAIDFTPSAVSGTLNAALVKHPSFDGKDLALTWDLTGVSADLSRLNGTASLRHGAGEFRNIRKLTAESRVARALLQPLTLVEKLDRASGGVLNLPSLDVVPFSAISGDYRFRDGVMTMAPFKLAATPFNAAVNGTVDLAREERVNARATLSLPPDVVRGTIGQMLGDAAGRVSVLINISGTVSAPEARIDMKDAGEKVEDLLRGLFSK